MKQTAAQRRALYKDVRTMYRITAELGRACGLPGLAGKQVLTESDVANLRELTQFGLVTLTKIETQLKEIK